MSELFRQIRWDPTPHNLTPPTEAVLDSPTRCIEINAKWASIIAGAIERLADYDLWDGDENTVETAIDKVEQILIQLGTECANGGGMGSYELQQDINFASDTTSYTINSLDVLSGRDLMLEFMMATGSGSKKGLRLQFNDLTTSVYRAQDTIWASATTYQAGISAYYEMRRAVALNDGGQNVWGWVRVEIPRWKDSGRYPHMHHISTVDGRHGKGGCIINSVGAITKVKIYASSGDMLAGSKIAVYTRG